MFETHEYGERLLFACSPFVSSRDARKEDDLQTTRGRESSGGSSSSVAMVSVKPTLVDYDVFFQTSRESKWSWTISINEKRHEVSSIDSAQSPKTRFVEMTWDERGDG